jgi:hypothetical protein
LEWAQRRSVKETARYKPVPIGWRFGVVAAEDLEAVHIEDLSDIMRVRAWLRLHDRVLPRVRDGLQRMRSYSAMAADPTPKQIADACRKIREGWSESTERARRVVQPRPFEFPWVSVVETPSGPRVEPLAGRTIERGVS